MIAAVIMMFFLKMSDFFLRLKLSVQLFFSSAFHFI